MISTQQIALYKAQGFIVVPDVLSPGELANLRSELADVVANAASVTSNDAIYDLEDSHTAQSPRVRRVKHPETVMPSVNALMRKPELVAILKQLIGPGVRFQTAKLNMKSAGHGAPVEWHQDWAFYPYTNDDVLAVGLIIDDMGPENGPLMVIPGSHKGPAYNHHHNGVFAGAMDLEAEGLSLKDAVPLQGPAGSISIHHVRIAHGSALNTSTKDRRIIFYEMMAADAFPIMGSMTKWDGIEDYNTRMLCGDTTIEPRLKDIPIRIPQPQPDVPISIYEIQKGMKKRAFETMG